jgi:hypothetical protein
MTIFICNAEGCANQGVIYDFGDEHPTEAMCGGCKVMLKAEK